MATVWEELRRDFPALDRHVYLNAAAASPTPQPVREAVTAFYRELESDADRRWSAWLDRREQVRSSVARLLRCPPRTLGWLSIQNHFAFDNRTDPRSRWGHGFPGGSGYPGHREAGGDSGGGPFLQQPG